MPSQSSPPLLRMSNISKSFPGIQALDDVSIEVRTGEILAIIGENGAGKSTLIKTLGGVHHPDSGSIRVNGETVNLLTPIQSQQAGIGIIFQEFNLIPFLTVRENIFLGNARQNWGVVDRKEETCVTNELFEKLGTQIDPDANVASLSIAEQQLVEIAKTLATNVKILVMDEPTATLTPSDSRRLFDVMAELKSQGIAIIYISHRLNEILEVADRMVVLRDGKMVGERNIAETNRREMIEMMVGRSIENEFPKHQHQPGETRLKVSHLTWKNRVRDVSFSVRAGEVLGITGLVGAGRTEVARLIAGANLPDGGDIEIDGHPVRLRSPRDGIAEGVCLLSEDRKGQGLVLGHSIQENFGLPNLDCFSSSGVLSLSAESKALLKYIDALQIKIANPNQPAGQLSGGNQQKLVLAKWLQRNCNIIIVDEPTRGIDVGAKYEIYLLINELAGQGKAVLMISSEIPEVLGIADRILVMREGKIAGEVTNPQVTTQEQIMELAAH